MKLKNLIITFLIIILISCGRRTNKTEIVTNEQIDTISTQVKKIPSLDHEQQTISSQNNLSESLNEQTVNQYFEDIYNQEKIIITRDDLMLSIPDSLLSNDPQKQLFYFIVFTKSMNGSDGFYSESAGLNAFNFITTRTEKFADYFNRSSKLIDKDLDNWAYHIFGEIQISREDQEIEAIDELEIQLLNNIEGTSNEYRAVIEKLIEKIRSTAHNIGYECMGFLGTETLSSSETPPQ